MYPDQSNYNDGVYDERKHLCFMIKSLLQSHGIDEVIRFCEGKLASVERYENNITSVKRDSHGLWEARSKLQKPTGNDL